MVERSRQRQYKDTIWAEKSAFLDSGARAELPHNTTEIPEQQAGEPAEAGSIQEPR